MKMPLRCAWIAAVVLGSLLAAGCRGVPDGSSGDPAGPAETGGEAGSGTVLPAGAVLPSDADLPAALRKLEKDVAAGEARIKKMKAKLEAFRPRGIHVVVDAGTNRLYLMDGSKMLREAIVSTGSGFRLVDVDGKRVWVFNTPRGEFQVQRKIVNPVWTKPDWAFIEDGEPIPKNFADRIDPDVLGDYALNLGDGYLIHGSLYKRTLGMSVTHGCVRVGDDDLEAVYRACPVGTKVYII